MSFDWLKRYMPRGLYGRAALILILPVVLVQLIVSISFVQRHYEGVTEQMMRSILLELRYLADQTAAADDLADPVRRNVKCARQRVGGEAKLGKFPGEDLARMDRRQLQDGPCIRDRR